MTDHTEIGRSLDVAALQARLRDFASSRDWQQFHSPKNLAMALTGEVGELVEILQWLTPEQSARLSKEDLSLAADELADIQIYLLRMADVLGLSLADAVDEKIERNEGRYPVELSKGEATRAARRVSD
jgi:dCTP diphosphatase